MIVTGILRIDELHDDVSSYAFDKVIAPLLERIGHYLVAPFGCWTPVSSAARMRLNLVRRPVLDVDSAAIGFPAGKSRAGVVIVGVCDAPVVFFFEFILSCSGNGIAALPELPDEFFALFVGGQTRKGGAFPIID